MKHRDGSDEVMVALGSTIWFCLGLLEGYSRLSDIPDIKPMKVPPVRKRRIR
jgi:hypothetical protein